MANTIKSRLWRPSAALMSCILSLQIAHPALAQAGQSSAIPVSSPSASPIEPARQTFAEEDWAKVRAAHIKDLLNDPTRLQAAKVLFVGDSITQFWTTAGIAAWKRAFEGPAAPYQAIDLGFAGDRTENLLFHLLGQDAGGDGFLDSSALDPDVIVLMIGVNNTWKTNGPVVEDVVAGNVAVIARLRQLRPRATIIVQSLLPAENTAHTEQYIIPINQSLQRTVVGLGPKVLWLDTYPLFVDPAGGPRAALFPDMVHPGANGYELWSKLLAAKLREVTAGH